MPKKGSRQLTIRMYRQGLGDCFLLSFPRDDGGEPYHLLIDCGALNSGHYTSELMRDVVRDIHATTGGRLDAVVATHEHWDHISGFLQAADVFETFEVDEVWASWTEEPENEEARKLKTRFKKAKETVEKAVTRMTDVNAGGHLGLYRHAISELFGFFGGLGVKGAGNTERAWKNYLNLSKQKRYCKPSKPPIVLPGMADVRVYVLGPPEDPDFIKKKLSKTETYDEGRHAFAAFSSFAAAFAGEDAEGLDTLERSFPFDARYRVLPETAWENPFFVTHYGFDEVSDSAWRRIDHDWLAHAGELALHLDSYTNNTCFAMALELGEEGKVLLFPGDAQVGNWLSWNKLTWRVKDGDGTSRTVAIDDLLARTVLYKVGHHGSHNATLRSKGLEKMTSEDLVAMIPVHRATADDQNWEFPYEPLWKRLREKCLGRVILADAVDLADVRGDLDRMLSASQTESFEEALEFNDLCITYTLEY